MYPLKEHKDNFGDIATHLIRFIGLAPLVKTIKFGLLNAFYIQSLAFSQAS